MPSKRDSKLNRLEYLDLDDIENDLEIVSIQARNIADYAKGVGFTILTGIFNAFLGGKTVEWASKAGLTQMDDLAEMMSEMCLTIKKIDKFQLEACILAPVLEELCFRGVIQGVLLQDLPKGIVKTIAPGKEKILNSTLAKTIRIALAASLFAFAHLSNEGRFPDSYVKAQVVGSLVSGVIYGILQESRLGLLSAIGAHFVNNCIASVMISLYC